MNLEELYMLVEEAGINVYNRRLPDKRCIIIPDRDGECNIAIDYDYYKTQAAEKEAVAHEYGHWVTDSFYSKDCPFELISKCERVADKMAVYTLIPFDELIDAVLSPWNTVYDLAEHFGVTMKFMQDALELYRDDLDAHYRENCCEYE